MPTLNTITSNQLIKLIGTPNCPVLIDVCVDEDFEKDPYLIPGAFRHSHNEIETLVPVLRGEKVVIICQKGRKLSQGAAAILRSHGIKTEALAGGMLQWRDEGKPAIKARSLPNPARGSLWVTRSRPKIDRIASPWLIRRFIDPKARFLFVEANEVLEVAEKFGATPFDVNNTRYSHQGANCTFDALMDAFCLSSDALDKVAEIVRAADTNNLDDIPEAKGLLAMSLGLSRLYRDDLEQLEAGLLFYDALYLWARDAQNETHDTALKLSKRNS